MARETVAAETSARAATLSSVTVARPVFVLVRVLFFSRLSLPDRRFSQQHYLSHL